MCPDERQLLGARGEQAAAEYLGRRGLKLVARNLRTPVGEIDLVLRDRRHLVFVEVKTRRGTGFGLPQEAVTTRKQRQILRAAQWYLNDHGPGRLQPRFDVVAVIERDGKTEIEHIENAFGLPA
ncbi:MAG: YraN family protein [Alphaproteobacteria bacterium]|nr:MAG: YraN family protein [Alphaproteobacteria bacterium]